MGRRGVKVAVDTNIFVRGAVRDDPEQADAAERVLREADLIAISLPCLCEFVWGLRRVYRFDSEAQSQPRSGHCSIRRMRS
jgi:predicted nucleic acid-binding protein